MIALRRLIDFAPAVLYMALLFWLSHRVSPPGAGLLWDKVAHLGAYTVLGLLMIRAFHGRRYPLRLAPSLWALAATALYGVFDEFHQSFVAGRSATGADVIADALGGLSAVLLAVLWTRAGTRLSRGPRVHRGRRR